jgi:hypothetical protein
VLLTDPAAHLTSRTGRRVFIRVNKKERHVSQPRFLHLPIPEETNRRAVSEAKAELGPGEEVAVQRIRSMLMMTPRLPLSTQKKIGVNVKDFAVIAPSPILMELHPESAKAVYGEDQPMLEFCVPEQGCLVSPDEALGLAVRLIGWAFFGDLDENPAILQAVEELKQAAESQQDDDPDAEVRIVGG